MSNIKTMKKVIVDVIVSYFNMMQFEYHTD